MNLSQRVFLQVAVVAFAPALHAGAARLLAADGLTLELEPHTGVLKGIELRGERVVPDGASGGLLIQDVAAGSAPVAVLAPPRKTETGAVQEARLDDLNLQTETTYTAHPDHVAVHVKIKDLSGTDRALRALFRVPLENLDWTWDDNLLRARSARRPGRYESLQKHYYDWKTSELVVDYPCVRFVSAYPFTCLRTETAAISLGLPLMMPRLFQTGYTRGEKDGFLEVAFDLGIAPDTDLFPSETEVAFVIYSPPEPAWGFRSAARRYYDIFPESFTKRVKKEGSWILGVDPGLLVAPWDFGIGFDETWLNPKGFPSIKYGDIFDFYSCNYDEPWGWWFSFPSQPGALSGGPTTKHAGVKTEPLKDHILNPVPDIAEFIKTSVGYDEDGEWLVTAMTDIKSRPGFSWAHAKYCLDPKVPGGIGAELLARRFGQIEKSRADGVNVDGVYLDSISPYCAFWPESYRRDIWPYIEVPLVYNTRNMRVAQLHAYSIWPWVKQLSEWLAERDLVLIGNVYPSVDKFFYPFLDMIGMESTGTMFNCPDEEYSYWRLYGFKKPVSWLEVNLTRNAGRREDAVTRRGFERCLAWGLYPGTIDLDAAGIDALEQLRPVFKQYMPWILETASTGWEPVPYARSSVPGVHVERFGSLPETDRMYLTAYNASLKPLRGMTLELEAGPLGLPSDPGDMLVEDLRTGQPLPVRQVDGAWRIALADVGAESTAVVRITTEPVRRRLYQERLRDRVRHIRQTLDWMIAAPVTDRAVYFTEEARGARAEQARNFPATNSLQRLLSAADEALAGTAPLDRGAVEKDLQAVVDAIRTLPPDGHRGAMRAEAYMAFRDLALAVPPVGEPAAPAPEAAAGLYHANLVSTVSGFRAVPYELSLDASGKVAAEPAGRPDAPALSGTWSTAGGRIRLALGSRSCEGFAGEKFLACAGPAGKARELWVAVRKSKDAGPGMFAPWGWGRVRYNLAGLQTAGRRSLLGLYQTLWSNEAMKFVSCLNLFDDFSEVYPTEWDAIQGYPAVDKTGAAGLTLHPPFGRGAGRPDLHGGVASGGDVFFVSGTLGGAEAENDVFLLGLKSPAVSPVVPAVRYGLVTTGDWPADAVLQIAPAGWSIRAESGTLLEGHVAVPDGTGGVYALQGRDGASLFWAFTDATGRTLVLADARSGPATFAIGFRL